MSRVRDPRGVVVCEDVTDGSVDLVLAMEEVWESEGAVLLLVVVAEVWDTD